MVVGRLGGIRCFRGGSGFGLRLVFFQRGCKQLVEVETEGSATARLGVRDFEIHWISSGFRISEWISGFHSGFLDFKVDFGFQNGFLDFKVDFGFQNGFLDFKWISGFQSGFLDFKVDFSRDFWISSEFLDFKADFWISKWISRGISGFKANFWISKRISGFHLNRYY